MAQTVKILSTEIALEEANTISLAGVVRCFNNTAVQVTITRANADGTIGTMSLAAGGIEYVYKVPSDTLASNTVIRAVSIAFS